jgi:2-dehydro-3-deoxyphosphogluconate aldolase / (4S)-4-hydroxy-2-oxoglutarate aldolase
VNGTRPAPSPLMAQSGVVAVLRARHATEYAPVIDALVGGGVRSIELTLSTEGVFEELPGLRKRFSGAAELGIGTITTPEQARQAITGGAEYLVTPIRSAEISACAREAGVPFFPGGFTPTELHANWADGATAVKVFPASMAGPAVIGHLRGPFPDIQVIPSGGVDIASAAEWIRAGALAVSLGGPLLGDAFKGGDLDALTGRARDLVARVAEARGR